MDLAVLKAELDVDPKNRGYSGMTDAAAAADLNTAYCSRQRPTIIAAELFEAIDRSEFALLDAAKQGRIDRVLSLGEGIRTQDSKARDEIVDVFGGESQTIQNLVALITESISRAQYLELGFVYPGDVENARM